MSVHFMRVSMRFTKSKLVLSEAKVKLGLGPPRLGVSKAQVMLKLGEVSWAVWPNILPIF